MKPNLFRWATSELTQDAFICWLLEWAKPELKGELINDLANKFIEEISGLNKIQIVDLEIRKQYKNIDIVVVINKKFAILIEDKVHTKNHSNQLSRYSDLLKEEFLEENLSLVYLKTGDQSNYKSVESKGYKTFKRSQFLNLLIQGKESGISNAIYIDFLNYLQNIDNSVNSFRTLPLDKWHWDSWKGFYIELQKRLGTGEWDYVPQKNGGFLGFWWHWNYMEYNGNGFDYYLQLEHGKFCFKISPYNVQYNYEIRDYFRHKLFQHASKHNINIKRNGRCVKGKTKTMTVGKLTSSYIIKNSNNVVELDQTVEKIREIEQLMNEIKTAHNKVLW